jgi:hypothetical protein
MPPWNPVGAAPRGLTSGGAKRLKAWSAHATSTRPRRVIGSWQEAASRERVPFAPRPGRLGSSRAATNTLAASRIPSGCEGAVSTPPVQAETSPSSEEASVLSAFPASLVTLELVAGRARARPRPRGLRGRSRRSHLSVTTHRSIPHGYRDWRARSCCLSRRSQGLRIVKRHAPSIPAGRGVRPQSWDSGFSIHPDPSKALQKARPRQ